MRLKQTAIILVPALGLVFALGAEAADNASPRKATTTTEATSRAAGGAIAQTQPGDIRASKLVGRNVVDAQGKDLGEIKDLIVDVHGGRILYAIVSYGGFLGLGEKSFAQPLTSFKRESGKDALVLAVDQAKLKDAPGFPNDRWPDWRQSDYRSRVDRFWGGGESKTGGSGAKPAQQYVRASKLLDADVELANGDDVGDIDDVVVNVRDGTVRYVVLDFDKKWSLDDKLVALPMSAFRPKDGGEDLVLASSSREQIRGAPAFAKDRWPAENDRDFSARVERWGESHSDRGTAASGGDRGASASDRGPAGSDARSR
jgi:sporulation protein YlmC with PRC-barrel domain